MTVHNMDGEEVDTVNDLVILSDRLFAGTTHHRHGYTEIERVAWQLHPRNAATTST
jgi:hypothetical protein